MLLSLEKALRKHPFLSQETNQPVEKALAELTRECMRLIVQSFLWEGK
jgi:hypothetical protein